MQVAKQKRIERRIADAVALVRRLGFQLVAHGHWGVEWRPRRGWRSAQPEHEVCLCGAIALAENPKGGAGVIAAIARKLRITVVQASALSNGFEGFHDWGTDSTRYRIGRKWRQRADRVED